MIKNNTKIEIKLDTPVQYLKGVGPHIAKKLNKLGIETARDLIYYFPRRYEDYTQISKIADIGKLINNQEIGNKHFTIKGSILGIANKKTSRRGFTVTEAVISDGSGTLKVVWFNQPFLAKMLPAGREVILNGKVSFNSFSHEYVMESPARAVKPCIVPIYGETAGISSYLIQKMVLAVSYKIEAISEYMPDEIKEKNNLFDIGEALRGIHSPKNSEELKQAQRRIAFDELFFISLKANLIREDLKNEKSVEIEVAEGVIVDFVHSLPFELTSDQKKAAWQIIKDMKQPSPMNRLLNGDVGSGKTVVAAIAAYVAVKAGYRVVFMVPTSILAGQHFESFKKLFKNEEIKVGLYTRERKETAGERTGKEKAQVLKSDLIIGTQALIQSGVVIDSIGLVIVDEQHRFGVKQRQAISKVVGRKEQEENSSINQQSTIDQLHPHFLSMTATPIPRTLHLALFGDLDISVISEKPKDRKEIKTRFVQDFNREKAYNFIQNQIEAGRQVFVICPLIEEGEKNEAAANLFEEDRKSVMAEYKKLKEKVFPRYRISMLHGRMKAGEKDEVMERFSLGQIDILVSTSVVEVGVDVPNASVMMIEDADRFGLAQIHQFRGRVGRSEHQSYCFLFSSTINPKALRRLESLEMTADGFRLAEIDLETRGPGEIFGISQSGDFELKMASMSDRVLIEEATNSAKKLVEEDRDLSRYPLLKDHVSVFLQNKHLE